MIDLVTTWNLRTVMASRGIFQTSKLGPLLAERGVTLSREQVYRLVTGTPQRLSLSVLAALCDALECSADDLISTSRRDRVAPVTTSSDSADTRASIGDLRPVRAEIRRPTGS